MNLEEIKKYLIHFQKYQDEKSFIILKNCFKRYLQYFAKKFDNLPFTYDELQSSILFGFYNALLSYDYQKNTMIPLTSYLYIAIKNQILNDLKYTKKNKELIILDEIVDENNSSTYLDNIIGLNEEDIFNIVNNDYYKDIIVEMLSCLSKKQQEVIKYRFGICGYPEKKLSELSNLFGCTIQFVSACEHKALKKMRKLYNDKYHDLVR